jgi:hypothetical protein
LVFEDLENWSLRFTGWNFGRLVNKANEDVSSAGFSGAWRFIIISWFSSSDLKSKNDIEASRVWKE